MSFAARRGGGGAGSGGGGGGFSLSLSPASLSVTGSSSVLTTGTCTATPTGNSGAVTYAWVLIDDGGMSPVSTASAPTSAATTFSQNGMPPAERVDVVWQVTGTDAASNVAVNTVPVAFNRT